jgi:hypothetical protein
MQTSQIAGAAVVQTTGQSAAAKAAASNSQSGSYDAAAKTAQMAGNISMATGITNAAMGAILLTQAAKHRKNAKDVEQAKNKEKNIDIDEKGEAKSSHGTADKMISSFKMNEAGQLLPNTPDPTNPAAMPNQVTQGSAIDKQKHVASMILNVSGKIAKEQKGAADAAEAQGMSALITGAGQVMQGWAQQNAAKAMKSVSANLQATSPIVAMPSLPPGNGIMASGFGGNLPIISAAVPNPGTSPGVVPPANKMAPDKSEKPLALGVGPSGFAGLPSPTPAGSGSAGGTASGSPASLAGNGVGGGGGGGGDGSAGGAEAMTREGSRYEGGGGGGAAYAAGGGKSDTSSGPDLSGMLDKLAAAGKAEDLGPKSGEEQFEREPASEAPYSFLARDADLFQRVHQAYQAKLKSGRLAVF